MTRTQTQAALRGAVVAQLAVWLGLAVLAAGASSCVLAKNERRFFSSCGSAQECGGNLCYQGLCTANCVDDSGCGGGVCLESLCAPRCGAAGTCPAKWVCNGTVCRPGDTADAAGDSATGDASSDSSDGATGDDSAGGTEPAVGRLAAGEAFTCAVLANGSTRCWGIAYNGQTGTGDKETVHVPTAAGVVPAATAVAASTDHACALVGDGGVVCWGGAGTGAIDGQPAIAAPITVAMPSQAVAVATGKAFSCALDKDGAVWCWGDNSLGQLGDGTTTARASAAKVHDLPPVQALAAGHEHACAVTSNQQLWCWGQFGAGWSQVAADQPYLQPVVVGITGPVADVAAGGVNTCAIAPDGSATCWGDNGLGQLAVGDSSPHEGPQVASTLGKVKRIALGDGEHACAITLAGKVLCWGQGAQGQLGDGKALRSGTAVEVANLSGALDVAVGFNHSCARLPGDQVWCWGGNEQGQTGNGTSDNEPNPVQMGTIADAKAVSVGHSHICVLRQGGGAWCSGGNAHGELGLGDFASHIVPQSVSGLTQGTRICAGQGQTCATVTPRTLRCWGGDLPVEALVPAPIPGLPDADDVATGAGTTCVLVDGGGYCMGNDDYGSLGDGPVQGPFATVVAVSGLAPAKAIAGKWHTFCAVLTSGGVQCWGRNDAQQAGVGKGTEVVTAPTDVTLAEATADPVVQVALAYNGACARRKSGTVVCWGEGGKDHTGQSAPLPPGAAPNFANTTDIALSNSTLCAITAGQVLCAGGEVPGGWQDGNPPTLLQLPAPAIDLDAGPSDVCAVLNNGTVWCWGYNEFGQLGNGQGPVLLPVKVLP